MTLVSQIQGMRGGVRMRKVQKVSVVVALLLCLAASAQNKQPAKEDVKVQGSHQHDFDWEIGDWKAHLRRLPHPLTGSNSWVEFDGTAHVRKVWDGRANLLELELHGSAGQIEGLSLRLYDLHSGRWNVYFATSEHGALGAPMVGQFQNGRGEFFSRKLFHGKMIEIHFVFSDVTDKSFHGEQSFSADEGKSWETNWIEDFTRTER